MEQNDTAMDEAYIEHVKAFKAENDMLFNVESIKSRLSDAKLVMEAPMASRTSSRKPAAQRTL